MRSILLLTCLLMAFPAEAILIRPDRDDAEYVELATRFPAAVLVAPGVEGVLFAPRWVLTSAHSATMLLGAKLRPPLVIGGKPNAILQTFIHPEWKQGTTADLALVLLRDPVTTIEPAQLSGERDEVDEVIFIVGHGETGRLGQSARSADGKKRAAINTIDRVMPATLAMRIKPADTASDLQGAAAANERGAPALAEVMGKPNVFGLYSADEGLWQVFVRVSTYTQWINETMFRGAVEEAAKAR
jgi:hypothetical protein